MDGWKTIFSFWVLVTLQWRAVKVGGCFFPGYPHELDWLEFELINGTVPRQEAIVELFGDPKGVYNILFLSRETCKSFRLYVVLTHGQEPETTSCK